MSRKKRTRSDHAKAYSIRLSDYRKAHNVPRPLWLLYLSIGLTERTGPRKARVRTGFAGWLDADGRLQFRNLDTSSGPCIFTNSQVIERWWVYNTSGPRLSPEAREREFLASYGIFAAPVEVS